ncbi:MAG: LamG domain-containing protein [Victivallaceae bacterium]|nr:LamG domain-containing protein [Victivallaceae bacterium]
MTCSLRNKTVSSPEKLKADCWSHIAMTYDQQKIRLFVNGKEVAGKEEKGDLSTDKRTTKISVGCHSTWWDDSSFWAGLLHDMRMYGKALPPEEIKNLASSPPPNPEEGMDFRSDGPPVWVFNKGLEGKYRKHKITNYPPQWYGTYFKGFKGRFRKDTENPHSGKAALMIECDENPFGGGMTLYQRLVRIPIIPGRTYTLSAWMRSDSETEDVSMGFNRCAELTKRVKLTRRWEKYTLTKTYTGTTMFSSIIFGYLSKQPGNVIIDDIEFKVEEEGTAGVVY